MQSTNNKLLYLPIKNVQLNHKLNKENMKKFILGLAAMLTLFSCAESNGTSDVVYISLTDEEKELFNNELGVNEALYIGNLQDKYKIDPNFPITVSKIDESSSVSKYDLATAAATYKILQKDIAAIEAADFDKFDNTTIEEVTIFDTKIQGAAINCGSNVHVSYLCLCEEADQRAYISFPSNAEMINNWVKEVENKPDFAGQSEFARTMSLLLIQTIKCDNPRLLTAFTHDLSNGTKVRVVYCAATK